MKKPTKRESWLDERKTYIGATDVAKILGVHPYGTAHDVWLEKRGELTKDETVPMWLGTQIEPVIAKHFSQRYKGSKVKHSRLYRHEKYPFCACNPDREITWQGHPALLECKMAGHFSAKQFGGDGSDAVPIHYLVQCLWLLIVTRVKFVVLYALLDNKEFQTYVYTLDPEFSTVAHVFPHEDVLSVFSKVVTWWKSHIEGGVEPEMSGHDSDTRFLQSARATYENGQRGAADEAITNQIIKLKASLVREARAELVVAERKNKIKSFMSANGLSVLDWGEADSKPVTWNLNVKGVAVFKHPYPSGRC